MSETYYKRAISETYRFEVPLDVSDYRLEARADAWLHSYSVDYMSYFEDDDDRWVYCFKEAKWATLFKLSFH